jgi:LysR family transcriptional regulator, glycine cleavage system transcriptional activator
MLPSLESLHCFLEAARLLNFRAAARSVALTPAALGQRIRQLEEQVGNALFHRTTRKVVLTQAGLALVPYARKALGTAEECLRAGRGEVGPTPMDLTLGTRHELGMSWVLPMLPQLRAAHAGLTLHLYFGMSGDLVIRVRNLEIDGAVGSMRITDPKLDSIRLHREEYVFVAQPKLLEDHPFRQPDDARHHTLVDTHAELPLFGYWREAPGGGDRLQFGRILLMGTTAAIRQLVLRGEGVAVLPLYLVQPDIEAGRLVRLFPKIKPLSDYFRLIFRTDDPRRSVYQTVADSMLKVPLR